jgi:hypothetical protein
MGHHYIPQHYLRNFQDVHDPGFIWMFDKDSGRGCLASITKVVQEASFYEPEIEASLNEIVEKPANRVIDKLLRREGITPEEKSYLALYIAVMLKRVPYHRQQASSSVPQALDDTVIEIRNCLRSLIGDEGVDQAVLHERLTQVDATYDKYKREPPPEVIRQIRAPWPTAEMVELVKGMTWRVLGTSGPNFFMTSDNPAFFFSAYGLKNADAEVCFPSSTLYALHCCWQETDADIVFLDAQQSVVREVNRRLASTTLRFAFYHERAEWLHKILSKESPYLSRIVW